MSMFCYQCQEASKGTGCNQSGVCGKTPEVAQLQDLLIYTVKGISEIVVKGKLAVDTLGPVNEMVLDSLFKTITNANFDDEAIIAQIKRNIIARDELAKKVDVPLSYAATGDIYFDEKTQSIDSILLEKIGVLATQNEDIRSLRELITYGIKGYAAYTHHALNLGKEDPTLYKNLKRIFVKINDT